MGRGVTHRRVPCPTERIVSGLAVGAIGALKALGAVDAVASSGVTELFTSTDDRITGVYGAVAQ